MTGVFFDLPTSFWRSIRMAGMVLACLLASTLASAQDALEKTIDQVDIDSLRIESILVRAAEVMSRYVEDDRFAAGAPIEEIVRQEVNEIIDEINAIKPGEITPYSKRLLNELVSKMNWKGAAEIASMPIKKLRTIGRKEGKVFFTVYFLQKMTDYLFRAAIASGILPPDQWYTWFITRLPYRQIYAAAGVWWLETFRKRRLEKAFDSHDTYEDVMKNFREVDAHLKLEPFEDVLYHFKDPEGVRQTLVLGSRKQTLSKLTALIGLEKGLRKFFTAISAKFKIDWFVKFIGFDYKSLEWDNLVSFSKEFGVAVDLRTKLAQDLHSEERTLLLLEQILNELEPGSEAAIAFDARFKKNFISVRDYARKPELVAWAKRLNEITDEQTTVDLIMQIPKSVTTRFEFMTLMEYYGVHYMATNFGPIYTWGSLEAFASEQRRFMAKAHGKTPLTELIDDAFLAEYVDFFRNTLKERTATNCVARMLNYNAVEGVRRRIEERRAKKKLKKTASE